MKIRIQQDQIRIRLTGGEIDKLLLGVKIQTEIGFSTDSTLTFILEKSENQQEEITMKEHQVRISIPATKLADWPLRDMPSLQYEKQITTQRKLLLVIEKDLHRGE
jgi:hypothetical protein